MSVAMSRSEMALLHAINATLAANRLRSQLKQPR